MSHGRASLLLALLLAWPVAGRGMGDPNVYLAAGACVQEAAEASQADVAWIEYRHPKGDDWKTGWGQPGKCVSVPDDQREALQVRCVGLRRARGNVPGLDRVYESPWVTGIEGSVNGCQAPESE